MVIDSLVLEFGLDASKFNQAQKDAINALRRFEEQATRSGKNIEAEGARFDAFFGRLKAQAIGLFGALMGARGIEQFVRQITTADAALGRAAHTMNMSTEQLSIWQGVAKASGGSAESMTGAMQGLTDEMYKLAVGIPSNILPALYALHVDFRKSNGELKTAGELMLDLNAAVQGMNPAEARVKLQALGLPPDVINTLLLGRGALRGLLAEQERIAAVSKQSAEASAGLVESWSQAEDAATNFGRALRDETAPALKLALDGIKEVFVWMKGNKVAFGDLAGIFLNPISGIATMLGRLAGRGIRAGGGNATEASVPPITGPAASRGLTLGPTAGAASPATQAAMDALAGLAGINRVTALNDAFHSGLGGLHPLGRALDLTVEGGKANSEAVAAAVRARLAAAGIDATVSNEYVKPSPHATGGHLHISLRPPAAAGAGAVPSAASVRPAGGGASTSTHTTTQSFSINITAPSGDGAAIGQAVVEQLRRWGAVAGQANYGQGG